MQRGKDNKTRGRGKELELQNTFTNESRRSTFTSTGEASVLRHEHGVFRGAYFS